MLDLTKQRPTWVETSLDNLSFNFQSVKSFVGENIKYMAVVKANAYGHGSVNCALRLEEEGIDCFGVALPEEGLELRKSGVKKPIICLGGFWTKQENMLLESNLIPVIYQLESANIFNAAAKRKNIVADVHIKIDTGMGRIGVRFDEIEEFTENLKKFKNLNIEGLMTHFSVADNLLENEFTKLQIDKFNKAVQLFETKGFRLVYKDLANSPAAIAHKNSLGNMVRLGGVLYGLADDVLPAETDKPELRPVMSLHSRVAFIKNVPKGETLGYGRTFQTEKDSVIATVPIGYHDGYPRLLSNRGRVIINGKYAPVVGRISMDWTIIDVSDIDNVKVKDEVILIGKQGCLEVKAEELAEVCNTISYEITFKISSRVI